MVSSNRFLSNLLSRDQPYSQRILEISLPHRFLPQNDGKCMGRGNQENPHFCLEEGWPESVVECDIEESETLVKILGLEVNSNDIDELVEEHSQELTT
ncbi:hypothetical protein AVEN_167296-1 [Araneus ventricosus]|uniref:Uncharacterized protein n=1 Tax=Araneus ventricosus TaxID=182803 RepID=A0A4Y2DD92_ARAVE|nr:hypothetical protein AVEN_167296-1 [Araneus ventricosus]